MKTKRSLCLITCLVVLGVQVSEAQFLNRVKDAVKKEANKVVDKISNENKEESNKDNKAEKPSTNQESNKEKEEDTQTIVNNGLTYSPPNDNFRAFSLQKHNGLPRFGLFNSYGYNDSRAASGRSHINKTPLDYTLYTELLNLKYGSEISMDLIINAVSAKVFLKYFCNEEKGDCKERNRDQVMEFSGSVRNSGGASRNWGGYGANQFEKERKKKDFMEKHAPTLVNWSKNLWENNTEIAYLVDKENLGKYDFEKGGYWLKSIAHPTAKGTGLISNTFHYEYIPENRIEKEMQKGWVLFKVNAAQAENLSNNKIRFLYSVVKIKLGFLREERDRSSVLKKNIQFFKYCYESPVVEFYEDEGLTKKTGEISYENVEHSSSMFAPNDTRFKN